MNTLSKFILSAFIMIVAVGTYLILRSPARVDVAGEPKNDTVLVGPDNGQVQSVRNDERPVTREQRTGTVLDLSGQGLTSVPQYVFTRSELTELNLSHNVLTGALQAEVRHLSKLERLDLSYNQFTGVPAEVGQLSELRYLNLSHNALTGLPYELGNLKKLEVLDLTGNNYAKADLAKIKEGLPASVRIIGE